MVNMKCDSCGKDIGDMRFTCKFCQGSFCSEHRLPENHDCQGLKEYKKRSTKRGIKYEPFKKENLREKPKREFKQSNFLSELEGLVDQTSKNFKNYTKILVISCVVVFFLQLILGTSFVKFFYLEPNFETILIKPWMLFTSIFLHGNFFHLFVNMFVLYFFGKELEHRIGSENFLILFFTTGIAANLGYLVFSQFTALKPALGASGAIFGVFAALAIIDPEIRVLLFFIFPMKIIHALILFGVYDLYRMFIRLAEPMSSVVASSAHLTGLVVGVLFGYYYRDKIRKRSISSF